MPHSRLFALAAILTLTLAGCAANDPLPTPTLTPPAESTALLNPELDPLELATITEDSTRVEGTRLADALQALIDPATILSVVDASQLAPADDDLAPYYVAQRTISLDPDVDCLTLAETLSSVLDESGWSVYDSRTEGGVFVAALSGGSESAPWFALVSGDATVEGQSTITFQIASPDIGS